MQTAEREATFVERISKRLSLHASGAAGR